MVKERSEGMSGIMDKHKGSSGKKKKDRLEEIDQVSHVRLYLNIWVKCMHGSKNNNPPCSAIRVEMSCTDMNFLLLFSSSSSCHV